MGGEENEMEEEGKAQDRGERGVREEKQSPLRTPGSGPRPP